MLDILPCSYSRIPAALGTLDVLFLQLAGPDDMGRLSLGVAHEYLVPLIDQAKCVVAEINARTPWTFGTMPIDKARVHYTIRTDRALPEMKPAAAGETERRIADIVAGLIPDRAVLQLGLGQIPDAVLSALSGHKDLGIHSGAITDKVADLMETGVITNNFKAIDHGITVAGVLLGSERLYRFANRNPTVHLRSVQYTHDPAVLASIERFTAINSAIEVDVTGQINAEVAAGAYVGAVGGAGEFLRGAACAPGGLPIVALPATTADGRTSRIVATLSGPVSTARCDAGIIVTQFGVADLRGCSLRERAQRMIGIAHPDFQEELARTLWK
jgi:acetyl-CoA hydrolase